VVAAAVISQLRTAERSIDWLADETGLSPVALRQKLSGGADFTVADLAEVAAALGISPTTLVPPGRPAS
jgi:transcriptional regulator with XRE-family HTH domain